MITWNGGNNGNCPVGRDVRVNAILRSGAFFQNVRAYEFDWGQCGGAGDIVAWSVAA